VRVEFPNIELSRFFVTERMAMEKRKEAGEPRPYSTDTHLGQWSFCHVEREKDITTRRIKELWRDPYREHPDGWFLMVVARCATNEPEIIAAITPPLPYDCDRFISEMRALEQAGKNVERAAYTINAPRDFKQLGYEHKFEYLAHHVLAPIWAARERVRPRLGDRNPCQAFCDRLRDFKGIAGFYAGQVVADAKFMRPLSDASDWHSFVISGPGSERGLNVIVGREWDEPWYDGEFYEAFNQWSAAMAPTFEAVGLSQISAQDRQGVLCESFKLWRARVQGINPRRRYCLPDGSKPKPSRKAKKPAALAPVATPAPATAPVATPAPVAAPVAPVGGQYTRFCSLARKFIVSAPGLRIRRQAPRLRRAASDAQAPAGLRLIFDVETDALADEATKLHCVCCADADTDEGVVEFGPEQITDALAYLSQADTLIGHNIATFDLPVLQRLYDWTPAPNVAIFDTLVGSRLILPHLDDLDDQATAMGDDPMGRVRGRHSLEAWATRFGATKVGADIGDWSQWTPEIQARCASDVSLNRQLWRFLQCDGYSKRAIKLERRASIVCNRIETDGVPFDREAAEQLQKEWTERREALAIELRQQLPGLKKLTSRVQIGKLLESRGWIPERRTEKTGQPAIDDELLEALPALYPEFTGIAEHDLLRRRIAQLSKGKQAWLKHIGDDGRIHGRLIHIGTPHSRAKHLTPNLAQVPNPKKGARYATECRALFRAPPGWAVVCCDQANLQDRAFAHYLAEFDSGAYAAEFVSGVDQHWRSAIALDLIGAEVERNKENPVHTAIREGAKRFRYAFYFGAGSLKAGRIIHDIARAVDQLDGSLHLVEKFFGAAHPNIDALTRVGKQARAKFMAAIPGLQRLRANLEQQVEERGWLVGLDKRRVPVRAKYSALNYQVTTAEAVVCKHWLTSTYAELASRYQYGWDGEVVITLWVHDEIAVCCKSEIAEQVAEILVRCAKAPGEVYGLKVPLDAACTIGRSWAGEPLAPTDPAPGAPADSTPAPEVLTVTVVTDEGVPWSDPISDLYADVGTISSPLVEPRMAPPQAPHDDPPVAPIPVQGDDYASDGSRTEAEADKHATEHAGEPFNDAHVRAQGYQLADAFDYTLPDGTLLYRQNRYELHPQIAPNKKRPRKRFLVHRTVNGADVLGAGPRHVLYNWPAIMRAGPGATVLVPEGENKAKALIERGLLATTVLSHHWSPECVAGLTGCHLIILADHDEDGRKLAAGARVKLAPVAASIRVVPAAHLWKHLPAGARPIKPHDDVKDWLQLGGDAARLLGICCEIPAGVSFEGVPLTVAEWLARDLPEPDLIMGHVISTTTRAILHANTGLGKTHFVMGMFGHSGAGRNFLHWQCRRPCQVLVIDGEMSRKLFRKRIEDTVRRLGVTPHGAHFFSKEDIEGFAPLNTAEGQAAIWRLIEEVERRSGKRLDAVCFDSIMGLIVGEMKDEEAWRDTLPLVHALTKREIGQLWVHHTGHDTSRGYGTKTREWQLDTVMHLDEVKRPDTDVSFTLTFPKARERTPDNRDDFAEISVALIEDQWRGFVVIAAKQKVPPLATKFLEALNAVLIRSSATVASLDEWQAECKDRGLLEYNKENAARAAFSKNKLQLIAANLIAVDAYTAWIL
jgi:DNA polymerase I-like protein with 3'-5' exonuclease and polymerase domains